MNQIAILVFIFIEHDFNIHSCTFVMMFFFATPIQGILKPDERENAILDMLEM
jgi:hypothetical protein